MAGKRNQSSLHLPLRPSLSLLAPLLLSSMRDSVLQGERAAGAERGGLLISHGCTSSVIGVASRRGA